MAIASGQITLVDLTDGINLQGYLTSTKPSFQFTDNKGNTYNPAWTSSSTNVVSIEINEVGKTGNLITGSMIQSIRWFYTLGSGARTEITKAVSDAGTIGKLELGKETKSPTLTITKNVLTLANTTLKLDVEVNYKYNASFPVETYKMFIDFALVVQGQQGAQGVQGPAGVGESSYFHIRYSQNANGSGMTTNPVGAIYMGTATNDSPTIENDPSLFAWVKIKGEQGGQGTQGPAGPNGQSSYLHIKYSNDGGATFTPNNGEDPGSWIGTAVDFNAADPTVVSAYTWVKAEGDVISVLGWTPDGFVFKNEQPEYLLAQMDLYKNGNVVTSGIAYQWYSQQVGANDDSADVGAGWKRMSNVANVATGVTTKTMTVYPAAVLNNQSFKCRATYNNVKYYTTINMIDQTDPYQIEMYAPAGTTFKNGVGSTTIKMKLYQNGEEVDPNGTEFNYTWNLYDKNGALVSGKTWNTKQITVNASDITEIGTPRCVVTEKATKMRFKW